MVYFRNKRFKTNFSLGVVQLLQKDKTKRLGAKRDFEEVQSKAFFSDINWDDLYNRKIQPPYNPNVVSCLFIFITALSYYRGKNEIS